MTRSGAAARRVGGVELLERAIGYALGAVQGMTPALLEAPTPCRDWDLRALLHHVDDSLAALLEGLAGHAVRPAPPAGPGAAWDRRADPASDDGPDPAAPGLAQERRADLAGDPARRFRDRAQRLLGALTRACDGEVVAIADLPLGAGVLAGAGAIEIAVHGWDIARACGRDRPVPDGLAVELLSLCPLLVGDAGRGGQFGAPVPVGPAACHGDRLIAFLGRDPAA